MEGPSHGHVGNDATGPRDPTTEQGLEADATVLTPSTSAILATGWQGSRSLRSARQRQEGNDRGDAERLSTGIILRGVRVALRGSRNGSDPPSSACRVRRCSERASKKRSEPHDRQRDATSPQTSRRRKPSKWCKTTRTEQDFRSGPPRAEARRARRAGVDAWSRSRWRGERRVVRSAGRATRMNPTREGCLQPGREASALKGSQGHEGPHRAVFGLCGRGTHEPRGWDRQRSTIAEVARKSKRLATCVARAAVDCRKAGAAPRALKVG